MSPADWFSELVTVYRGWMSEWISEGGWEVHLITQWLIYIPTFNWCIIFDAILLAICVVCYLSGIPETSCRKNEFLQRLGRLCCRIRWRGLRTLAGWVMHADFTYNVNLRETHELKRIVEVFVRLFGKAIKSRKCSWKLRRHRKRKKWTKTRWRRREKAANSLYPVVFVLVHRSRLVICHF